MLRLIIIFMYVNFSLSVYVSMPVMIKYPLDESKKKKLPRAAGETSHLRNAASLYIICQWEDLLSSLLIQIAVVSFTLKRSRLNFYFWTRSIAGLLM